MDLQQMMESGLLEPWQVDMLLQQQAQRLEDLQNQVLQNAEDMNHRAWMASHDAQYGSNMTGLTAKLRADADEASKAVYDRYVTLLHQP